MLLKAIIVVEIIEDSNTIVIFDMVWGEEENKNNNDEDQDRNLHMDLENNS